MTASASTRISTRNGRISLTSTVAIAEHILTTGDASGYLKFLTTGGSDYPLEELKIAGIDLTKPDTVRSALRVFDETVDELSALLL